MMKDDDFKLLKGFALRRTDERTNGQTFAIVESLSRLKIQVVYICNDYPTGCFINILKLQLLMIRYHFRDKDQQESVRC